LNVIVYCVVNVVLTNVFLTFVRLNIGTVRQRTFLSATSTTAAAIALWPIIRVTV
jgi:hypothetical protein